MGAHPQGPSAPSAASSSTRSHGSHRRSPQSWLNRIMSSHREQPSADDSTAGVQELEYYGSSYGLNPPRPLQLTDVTDEKSRKRDVAKLSSDWSYVGCVEESDGGRLLSGFGFASTLQNSISVCTAICGQMGYSMAGAEFGQECYCGNSFTGDGGQVFADSECNLPCPGDSSQSCGNGWRIALYKRDASAVSSSTAATTTASLTRSGSIANATTTLLNPAANATITANVSQTASATSSAPTSIHTDLADSSEWYSLGCAIDEEGRILADYYTAQKNMTIDLCLDICEDKGYKFAGLEYGEECMCGTSLKKDISYTSNEWECSTPCAGDATESCGGGWRMEVFEMASAGGASSRPVNSNTASRTASATVSAPTSIHTDTTDMSEWYQLGCAIDEGGRVLTDHYVSRNDMTIDLCLDICEDAGFKYAGVEYGQECMCGKTLRSDVAYTSNEWECSTPCAGDATESCGGGWRMVLHELASSGDVEYCDETSTSAAAASTSSRTTLIVNNHAASTVRLPTSTSKSATSASVVPAKSTASSASVVPTTRTASAAVSTATGAVVKGSTTIPSSSAAHQVFAHHMVGNTYPYTQSNWATDIKLAKAASIDGFALNIGGDWWQSSRANDAYLAAEAAGDFVMFLSLDMTSLSCSSYTDGIALANLVKAHSSSSAQAMFNGKVLVSTFSGENCLFGQSNVHDGWNSVFLALLDAAGIDIFFVPSVFSDPSTFSASTWMDGELNWNGGWPMDSTDISTSSDAEYMNALGSKEYMAAISPAFFTHFPVNGWNKNWIYRGDNWLYSKRWEDVIAMRDRVKMVEILTWNDYGEASYIGPIDGALPSGSETWTNGYPHTAWLQLTKYYAQAFKTGSWPTIASDSIVVWARPHPKAATASSDSIGRPSGWDRTDDNLYALVFATDSATVTLTAGKNTQTYPVTQGVNKLKLASAPGSITAKLVRNGQTVTSYDAGSAYTYTETPSTYNFNYFVGSSS